MQAYQADPSSYERRVAQVSNLGYNTPNEGSPWNVPSPELEPGQAPRVFEEVVQLLKGNPSDEELVRAFVDMRAACDADYERACVFLKEQVRAPVKLEGEVVHPTGEPGFISARYAVVILGCRLDVDGRLRDCQVIETGPGRYAEQLIAQTSAHRYSPFMLAGRPVRSRYHVNYNLWLGGPGNMDLPMDKKLEWARLRVGWTPTSSSAWTNLAAQLAVHAPEDPQYPGALEQAYALAPRYWWTATEMAWQRIQAGQHSDALMALRPAIRRSSLGEHPNPYVLETAAAAHIGLKQCTEALAEQRKAVELLPAEWLASERERFQRRLQDYQSACAAP
ncbi:hypothetical protein HI113_21620 [Corallococcus exiguus]|uniref:hypothetical protein n=1 Tax=Corallococcus exiguus TaxID=83462 RepID=UPI0014725ECD|nr:hypothetical protein [Corallococcus exiguus]NNB87574.1 hypothetical protein [Corallococcus exiguus]NNB96499.1 hypothetical protein [Corallococcus exiguus]